MASAVDVAREGLDVDARLAIASFGLGVDDIDIELDEMNGDLDGLRPLGQPSSRPRVEEALEIVRKTLEVLRREAMPQVVSTSDRLNCSARRC